LAERKAALRLTAAQMAAMLAQVRAALPEEACGILAGLDGVVTRVLPITNSLHSPVRFRMDAQEQLEALLWLEDNQLELLAIYHSHPRGPERPSPTDVDEFAYPPALTLIWSPRPDLSGGDVDWQVRAFAIQKKAVREVKMQVET
jgi:proteasome lid subunit RPN8/RPN11